MSAFETPEELEAVSRYVAAHQQYMSVATRKDLVRLLEKARGACRKAVERAGAEAREEMGDAVVRCPVMADGNRVRPGMRVCWKDVPAEAADCRAVSGSLAVVDKGDGLLAVDPMALMAFAPDTVDAVLADAALRPAEYCRRRALKGDDPEQEKALDLVARMGAIAGVG